MKKLSIAFLAAMSITSFGCKKHGAGEAIQKMTEFKDKMCACKDKGCTEKVTDEMTKWGQEQAKNAGADKDAKMSEEDTKKMAAVTEEMTKCMTKIMTDAAMSGAGAAPAGGMAPAGGAAPAAADGSAAAPAAGGAAPAAADGSAAAAPAAADGSGSAAAK